MMRNKNTAASPVKAGADVAPVSGLHTPTPWRLERNKLTGDAKYLMAGNYSVAMFFQGYDDAENNAQFVLRACNCHDELLAACRALMAYVDLTGWGDLALSGTGDKGKDTLAEAAVSMTRAALARAEGGKS